jgi:crotonobetainyl-CoA:carnitine CoA-transferase CaiB-like acyl-CoA transferase
MVSAPGPLHGVRVADLTRFVSGSYATMLLAALGADVIKVEGVPEGDPYRSQGTAFVAGRSALFQSLNNGKRSLAVDLRAPAALDVLDRLLGSVDVLVENGRPGSLHRLGLDAPTVRARYPRLIYASISGYGQQGPDAARGGFDLILQAEGGLMSVTGAPESGPVKVGVPILDIGSGVSCALAVLSALWERERTGRGQHVSSSLLEFALACFTSVAPGYLAGGDLPGLLGSHSPTFAPYGAFRARDGHLVLAGAGSEALWQRCCEVLDRPDLPRDERFATNERRVEHRDELTAEIEHALAGEDVRVWLERFAAAGVPAARVQDLGQVLTSRQVGALGLLREQHAPGLAYQSIGPPFQLDGPLAYPAAAPDLGQHSAQILTELGLDPATVSELRATGVVVAPTGAARQESA